MPHINLISDHFYFMVQYPETQGKYRKWPFFKVIHFYNKIIVKKLLLKIYANLGAEARVS